MGGKAEAQRHLGTELQLLNQSETWLSNLTKRWGPEGIRYPELTPILLSPLLSLRWNVWSRAEVWAGDGGAPPCGIRSATARALSRRLFHYVHSSRGGKSLAHSPRKCCTSFRPGHVKNASSVQGGRMKHCCVFPGGGSCKRWVSWVLHKGVAEAGSVCRQLAQNHRWELMN